MLFTEAKFRKAVPVWAKEKAGEINCSLLFETTVTKGEGTQLFIAGANDYQIFVNGAFFFYGPARAGRGHYRVDELSLDAYLTEEENRIEILASAYGIDTFCFFNEAGFVCAEVVRGDEVLCATGDGVSFSVHEYAQKIRKTQRYSFQRTFAEVYDMKAARAGAALTLAACPEKKFIAREVPYPAFERERASAIGCGTVAPCLRDELFADRAIMDVGKGVVGGFPLSELSVCSVHEAQLLSFSPMAACADPLPKTLSPDTYTRFAMAGERTGFFSLDVACEQDTTLLLTFDEILDEEGKLSFTRMECSNVLLYRLKGGMRYHLVSAQPYSFQYLDVTSVGGTLSLLSVEVIRLDFDARLIGKRLSAKADADIAKIYAAAIETFRQNVVDIYMDGPSRERAGWLCDSFFTSRVERLLTKKSVVERAFLADFAMEDTYRYGLPDGMLPMCYPSEHADGVFIPNWAMWYVLELEEYLARTGDRAFVDALRDKVYRLLAYFKKFENADGLLERLDSWVFVEWSRCNQLVQDINYPSNMLYYALLTAVGRLYDDTALFEKALHLKNVIRSESRLGTFFCDNAVFRDGKKELSGECTETCQYYAFFTGVADVETDKALWETMVTSFGAKRKKTGEYPEIHFSNAFIGNYLRCELLLRNGLKEQLDADIRGYFLGMANRTGTLWEHDSGWASCNHGFASHVLVWLDALGYLAD